MDKISRLLTPVRRAAAIFSLAAVAAAFLAAASRLPTADPKLYLEHVKTLADPALEGRWSGTRGLEIAAEYIAAQFERFGLQPAGDERSYYQRFTVTTGAHLGPDHHFIVRQGTARTELKTKEDYLPLNFSSTGEVEGNVVFAGFGASAAEEFDYDDFEGLDVKGKVVVILRGEPRKFNPDNSPQPTRHAHLISKAINARDRGAKAVVLVNEKRGPDEEDTLIKFGSVSGPKDAGILIVHARRAVVDEWLKPLGKSLAGLQEAIDAGEKPQSFALPEKLRVSLAVDIEREHATVRNVLGFLPGKTKEYVIVGAHYDHLGRGNESSLAPSQIGQVHPGADDNASGTAALLEVARILAGRGEQLGRGVLFIAFAAEEIGLLGARDWVEHPTLPIENAVAMINMDMVGRIRGGKVYVGGTGTGSTFEELLAKVAHRHPLKLDTAKSGYSSSDHTVFVTRKVPVLFFFSGLHSDYHKPSDTWDKINAEAAAELVDLVADVTIELAQTERPRFVRVTPETSGHPAAIGATGSGYGAYFGSIPDFGEIENGVRFADIRPGSPADKAGIRAGDVLVEFRGKPIRNLYDFTYALRASKVGETVEVKVLRDGKPVTAKVTLGQRR